MLERVTPRRLGKYEIRERIGAGGMAEVFRAEVHGAAGFRRHVALKMIRAVKSLGLRNGHLGFTGAVDLSNLAEVYKKALADEDLKGKVVLLDFWAVCPC